MYKYFVVVLVSIFTFTGQANAESNTQKIEQLLELTGALALGEQVGKEMLKSMKPMYPKEAHPLMARLLDSMTGDDYKTLVIGLYQENFTGPELDAMIAFYSSEHGKAIMKKMPKVVQESMQVGRVYGRIKAEKLIEQLKAEGYEPAKI